MIATLNPQLEERAALRRFRALERARRVKAHRDAQRARTALRTALKATRRRYPTCTCRLDVSQSRSELIELGSGCCARYVCPRLDAVRRAVGI